MPGSQTRQHQQFQVVDWGKLRMDSPSAIATRMRAVKSGGLACSSVDGLAAPQTVARLLELTWSPIADPQPGVHKAAPIATNSSLIVTGRRPAIATMTNTVVVIDPEPRSWGSAVGPVTLGPVAIGPSRTRARISASAARLR